MSRYGGGDVTLSSSLDIMVLFVPAACPPALLAQVPVGFGFSPGEALQVVQSCACAGVELLGGGVPGSGILLGDDSRAG